MSPALLPRALCRFCGKYRHPAEFIHNVTVGYCRDCYEWHAHALAVLTGGIPRGCQVCGITGEELERLDPAGNIRVYLHRKDDMYQVLCKRCSDKYERKRLDVFAGTPHGWVNKLAGAK